MIETQPDRKLMEWIGIPDPPYAIEGQRGPVERVFGWIALIIMLVVAVVLPVAVFGFTSEGRALLVDSGLALGLGNRAPEIQVTLRECEFYRSTGRYGTNGWDCIYDLRHAGVVTEHHVELDAEAEAGLHRGAGTLMGATGLYWPVGVLVGQWTGTILLFVISGFLLAVCWVVRRDVLAQAKLRNGRARSVDLLSRGGKPWFAFVDDDGVRRFQQADFDAVPLHVDALLTNGIALVAGQKATLLYPALWPLKLPAGERDAILARIDEAYRQGMYRKALPPQPGDPETAAARLERIEAALAGHPGTADLDRLYDDAWRLCWDNADAAISGRVFDARDAIAIRLGPDAAWNALNRSRARFASPSGA